MTDTIDMAPATTADAATTTIDIALITEFLQRFGTTLGTRDREQIAQLFLPDAGWRDLLAFTWNIRQAHDRGEIVDLLASVLDDIDPSLFGLDQDKPAPDLADTGTDETVIEVFSTFITSVGRGRAVFMLVPDEASPAGFRVKSWFTQLMSLHGVTPQWPQTERFDAVHPDERWSDHIAAKRAYKDRDPEVLIVGGGQFGVMTAAHLARLGVDALIIDKQPRIGDSWRTRYESLLLHQPHGMLYFSFMKFPESFPEYIPKDKIANWFDTYVENLDLHYWTSTEFLGGTYDEAEQRWTARIRQADGTVRTMNPRHLVMATGGSNIPNIPELPGIEEFKGKALHADEFRSGDDYQDKDVLIFGVGTTAVDIALDIAKAGGRPALVQRGPQIIVDLPTANSLYGDYNERKVPTDLVDLRFMSGLVYPSMVRSYVAFNAVAEETDAELHRALDGVGLQQWAGEGNTGFFYNFFKTYGGFYINVGGAQALVDGRISLVQLSDIETFDANGIRLADGKHRDFDTVVYATGHRPPQDGIAQALGQKIADKIGPVWGFSADGEMRNVWKPTPQEGLWVMMGGIPQARWYSPMVALLIKAELEGVVPAEFKEPDHPSRTPAGDPPSVAECLAEGN